MIKEFRLIQVIESVDNITRDDIEIFELTPIEFNHKKTGYNCIPEPSANNYFFIYQTSDNASNEFMDNPEQIKTMDLTQFEQINIQTQEGIRKTFFSNKLAEKRKKIR